MTPVTLDPNTFVFGTYIVGWFKMVALDAFGGSPKVRHTKAIRNLDDLTITIWDNANVNGPNAYKVEDIVLCRTGDCKPRSMR